MFRPGNLCLFKFPPRIYFCVEVSSIDTARVYHDVACCQHCKCVFCSCPPPPRYNKNSRECAFTKTKQAERRPPLIPLVGTIAQKVFSLHLCVALGHVAFTPMVLQAFLPYRLVLDSRSPRGAQVCFCTNEMELFCICALLCIAARAASGGGSGGGTAPCRVAACLQGAAAHGGLVWRLSRQVPRRPLEHRFRAATQAGEQKIWKRKTTWQSFAAVSVV